MMAKPNGVLEILIAKPSWFRDHDRKTQCVFEILIAKPSGFRDHDRKYQEGFGDPNRQSQWVP